MREHGYRLSALFIDRLGDLIFDLQSAGFDHVAEALVAVLEHVEDEEKGGEIGHGYRVVQAMRGTARGGDLPQLRAEAVQGLPDARPTDGTVEGGSEPLAPGTGGSGHLREVVEPSRSLIILSRRATFFGLPKKEQRP